MLQETRLLTDIHYKLREPCIEKYREHIAIIWMFICSLIFYGALYLIISKKDLDLIIIMVFSYLINLLGMLISECHWLCCGVYNMYDIESYNEHIKKLVESEKFYMKSQRSSFDNQLQTWGMYPDICIDNTVMTNTVIDKNDVPFLVKITFELSFKNEYSLNKSRSDKLSDSCCFDIRAGEKIEYHGCDVERHHYIFLVDKISFYRILCVRSILTFLCLNFLCGVFDLLNTKTVIIKKTFGFNQRTV